MADTTGKFQVLETSEFFADVPTTVRETVLSAARLRRLMCRQLMFVVGDPVTETLLLLQGCVKVSQDTPEGEEVALRIAAPGELVGELGSKSGSKHCTTAEALQPCEALAWTGETFGTALTRFPILQRNLDNILLRHISEMENRICCVSTQLASGRVASELIQLSNQIGQKVNSHVEIKIPQEALAQMTGINVWTLNKTLRGFENQGLLRIRRMCIEVDDSPRLLGLCTRPSWIFRHGAHASLLS